MIPESSINSFALMSMLGYVWLVNSLGRHDWLITWAIEVGDVINQTSNRKLIVVDLLGSMSISSSLPVSANVVTAAFRKHLLRLWFLRGFWIFCAYSCVCFCGAAWWQTWWCLTHTSTWTPSWPPSPPSWRRSQTTDPQTWTRWFVPSV